MVRREENVGSSCHVCTASTPFIRNQSEIELRMPPRSPLWAVFSCECPILFWGFLEESVQDAEAFLQTVVEKQQSILKGAICDLL